jgi:ElaA protein
MINFTWHTFAELTTAQLYAILALRADIFIVEQNCVFLDADGKDFFAQHLLGMTQGKLVAYLRLFPPTDIENYLVFGRIVTARSARHQGYGKQLMQELLQYCATHFPNTHLQCSAQYYLKKFYESFGFQAYGDTYLEDNIPHIAMKRISLA